jgi:MarR family
VSVLDEFRSAEQRVAKRLRELKPLVEEYHALEQVAERLGLDVDEDATVRGEQRPASPGGAQGRSQGSKTKARSAASTREESGGAAPAKGSAVTASPRRARARRAGRKGGPGSNRTSRRQQDVLRLVNQRPGITVREIGEELGVDPTSLYRPVHKLEQQGAISKRGAALEPSAR